MRRDGGFCVSTTMHCAIEIYAIELICIRMPNSMLNARSFGFVIRCAHTVMTFSMQ